MWLFDSHFNGDVWYPYTCPLTKKQTTPVKDLGTVEILSRIGQSLGLEALPSFYFRYNMYPSTDNKVHWIVYSLSEQLALAAKLVLAFHQRRSGDCGFTLCIRENHVITVRCWRPYGTDGTDECEFSMGLHIIPPSGVPTRHVLELCFKEGIINPFPKCRFVSVMVDIDSDNE